MGCELVGVELNEMELCRDVADEDALGATETVESELDEDERSNTEPSKTVNFSETSVERTVLGGNESGYEELGEAWPGDDEPEEDERG